MGTTPTYSWPYPDDTDPVADGAQNIEDLALAVETTLSAVGDSTAFTPSWTNVTVGDGVQTAWYVQINELLHVICELEFGSTTAFTGAVQLANPTGAVLRDIRGIVGNVWMIDSTGTNFAGFTRVAGSTNVQPQSYLASGSYLTFQNISATNPFTWATGDKLIISYTVSTF